MKAATIAVLIGISVSANAGAQDVNFKKSEGLLLACQTMIRSYEGDRSASQTDALNCVAYLHGFRDALAAAKVVGDQICVPQAASNVQLARVIVKHLQENPAQHHLIWAVGAGAALMNAYPCK